MGGSKFEASYGDTRIEIDPNIWDTGGASIFLKRSSRWGFEIALHADDAYLVNDEGGRLILAAHENVEVRSDFDVQGSKNAVVETSQGKVAVSAYETAEYYFGDIGRGEVINGECKVEIEPLFKETINTDIDYEVFLTPYGKGLIYVDEMTPDYFVVKGDDISFAYEIKAKRKGYEDVRLEARDDVDV